MSENGVETGAPTLSSVPTGDVAAPVVDVAQPQGQAETQPTTPPPGYVPQEDLNKLRSSLQRQADTAKAEAERYQQELQQVRQTQAITSRAQEYYQAYLAEGQDPAQAEQAALYYAQEDYQASLAVQSDRTDAQRYREQQQRQAQQQRLTSVHTDLIKAGLTEDEISTATGYLLPEDFQSFQAWEAAVRRAATFAAQTKGRTADPTSQARQVRAGMPIPGGGSAGGVGELRVNLRDKDARARLLAQQRALEAQR